MNPLFAHPLRRLLITAAICSSLLALLPNFAGAAPAEQASGPEAGAPAKTLPATSGLGWKNLSPTQQQALQPLAPHWRRLSEERRRKWLMISKNYANLPADEQAKMHRRMSNWVSLSQHQRAQARRNFKETKDLTAEQKANQWAAYQALSPEEKRKLAARARSKPAGAATVKAASSTKLAKVPYKRLAASAGANRPIRPNTLLPQPAAVTLEAAPTEADPETHEDQ